MPHPFRLRRATAVAAVLLAAVAGCGQQSTGEAVATVNGQPVTQKELYDRLLTLPYPSPTGGRIPAGAMALRAIAQEKAILDAARAKGVLPSDADVQKNIDRLKIMNPSLFERPDADEKQLFDQARLQLTFQKLIVADVPVTEDEIKKEYDKQKAQMTVPAMARYMMFTVADQKKGQELADVLKKAPQSFAQVAQQNAIDPMGSAGSQSTWVRLGDTTSVVGGTPPEVIAQLKTMNQGEVAGPVKLPSGAYALIDLQEKRPAKTFTLDDVRDILKLTVQTTKMAADRKLSQQAQQLQQSLQSPAITTSIASLKQFVEAPPRAAMPGAPGGPPTGGAPAPSGAVPPAAAAPPRGAAPPTGTPAPATGR
jgi:hypothetical protein